MSLTVVLEGLDGLVLAADSRTTRGYTLDGPRSTDDCQKLLPLAGGWGSLTYGLSEIGCAGLATLQREADRKSLVEKSYAGLAELAVRVFQKESMDWSRAHPEVARRDRDVGFVLAGLDPESNTFRILSLQSPGFDPRPVQTGCVLGGQWHIAKFLVDRLYRRSMPIPAIVKLATFLIKATAEAEITVGGPVRLATITKDDGFQWERSFTEVQRFVDEHFSRFGEALLSSLQGAVRIGERQ